LTILRAFLASYLLELRLGLFSRRACALALLYAAPLALAYPLRRLQAFVSSGVNQDVFISFADLGYFIFLVPLGSLVLASTMIGREVEEGTWHYRLLTPLPTWMTLLAKQCGAVTIVVLLSCPSLILSSLVYGIADGGGVRGYLEVALSMSPGLALAAVAYVALFSSLGMLLKQPLVVGIVYFLVSEIGLQFIPADTVIRELTIIFHARGVGYPEVARGAEGAGTMAGASIIYLEAPGTAAWHLTFIALTLLVISALTIRVRQIGARSE